MKVILVVLFDGVGYGFVRKGGRGGLRSTWLIRKGGSGECERLNHACLLRK